MHSAADSTCITPNRIREIADQCVKCGLCLPSCPTYQLHKSEAESPRGRIAMAHALTRDAHVTRSTKEHLSSCLACGICESVCPSRVPYQELISGVRARIGADRQEPLLRRTARHLLEHPSRLSRLLPFARVFYAPLRAFTRKRNSAAPANVSIDRPQRDGAASVALLSGCTSASMEPQALDAAEALMRHCGLRIQRMPPQCCGALALHSGDHATATRLGVEWRSQLSSSSAASCTGIVTGCARRCSDIAAAQTPYQDPIELLWTHRTHLRFRTDTRVVALHLPCTQRCSPASVSATQSLLGLIPGLRLVTLPHRGRCCGAAGTYALDHATSAEALRAPILQDLGQSGAALVLSANIGCRMQLADGCDLPVLHPLEFLHSLLEVSP
jgi:glycolate oxidase iron-sulfur subunit